MSEEAMKIHYTGKKSEIRIPDYFRRLVVYCLVFLFLVSIPATAIQFTGDTGAQKNPDFSNEKPDTAFITEKIPLSSAPEARLDSSSNHQLTGITSKTLLTSPGAITARPSPTPLPVRRNQTLIFQTIAKNAAERPKITVPAFWFGVVVAIAFAGLGAILYILISRRPETTAAKKKHNEAGAGQGTVIDQSVQQSQKKAAELQGIGVAFPPSLEKRFLKPEFIGEGGLARVFRAMNAKDGRIVAIKVPIRFDEVTGTHFARDISFWQGLHHPNIIEIYSSNILPVPYVEMEYAPSSLADIPLPVSEEKAREIIKGVARGIAYAHEQGIVHRDIKPENILIAADGTPKITDWGLGKAMHDRRQSSMIGFSPVYAAPEQISPAMYGKPGPATDIYQLGVLFYLMLTGNVPFHREDMHEMSMAILHDAFPVITWGGANEGKIQPILKKCLEKRPEARYDSVASLLADLETVHQPQE